MTPQVVCVGDNVVDLYVDEGIGFPGGNAVNVAVHATRLGTTMGRPPAAYVGVLGDDEAGRHVLAALEDEAVDLTRSRVVAGANAFARGRLINGDRVFLPGSIGVSEFVPDAADLALVATSHITHTGECSMLEPHLAALSDAAQFLSFDFSERDWDYVADYAQFADLAILSRPASSPEDPLEVANKVLALGAPQVVVSSGVSGALWADGSRHVWAQAPDADVVDTLGAGDSLIARLLMGLATAQTPEIFLPAATAYATASCMTRGAFGNSFSFDPQSIGSAIPSNPTP